jgi:hypothetical protein
MVETSLSAIELAFGARGGVRTPAIPKTAGPGIEVPAIDGVPVVDKVGRLATPWCRLKELLPDPGRRRTGGHVAMDQPTAVVADEEEDVQDPVVDGVDHQQIGCPDAPEFIREEGPPALALRRASAYATDIGGWSGY